MVCSGGFALAAEIHIIKPGVLVRDSAGFILDARSTVSLILDGKNIVVDTGVRSEGKKMIDGLKRFGLEPQDVDIVVNTHLHGDHTGNNALFSDAVFVHHIKEGGATGRTDAPSRKIITSDEPLTSSVDIIETPGHTRGSISAVVRCSDDSIYIAAGDALPIIDNYRKWVPPGIHYDRKTALDSMERIVKLADFVIPGHDRMFRVGDMKSSKRRD